MFFDIIAVLIITFFAALGMIELSEWLLKNPLRKEAKQVKIHVIKVNSIKEENTEQVLRFILSEGPEEEIHFLLDLRDISPTAKEICENLRRRYGFGVFEREETAVSFIKESLQEL